MWINNALLNGKKVNIEVQNGKITSITEKSAPKDFDAHGLEVFAGLIDVHTHGCAGMDTMDASFEPMCRFYAEHGTTAFLPTTMTMPPEALRRVTEAPAKFAGAQILGFHLEGPYISPLKKGAQNEKYIKLPDYDEFKSFNNVKMITVAPEVQGSIDFIKRASVDCVVSIGHTCADYDQADAAIKAGASCLTHTFNAMPPMLHRDMGPIGAGFMNRIYAQLICDGFHVSKAAVLALYKLFGADRLTLISDSIRPAGLPDGEYESGGLSVTLKDGAARLHDGTIAGSSAMLFDCVKQAIRFGIPKEDAFRMASATPAEMLGVSKGKIEVGFDADIILVDQELNLKNVIIGGELFA